MKKSRIVITCAKGVPPFLKEEVLSLGLPVLSETVAGVETEGTEEDAMRLNLFLRTGQRVLLLLREMEALNADDLYRGISRIAWEDYVPPEDYLCVTSAVDNPTIRDSRFANLKCKDAIVDRIMRKVGRRPDSGPERTGAVVDLYWKGDLCLVYLDTSGEPLYRRGYRRIPLHAPMQETLAAAVIQATGWKGEGNFVNPMCGSGTVAVEAVLMALDMAPGLLRKNFGFMHLKGFNRSSWKKMQEEARARVKKSFPGKLVATDIDPGAIRASRQNAAAAGIAPHIEFSVGDYSETPLPEGGGVVILNPEYGERMGRIEELKEVYRGIGDFFKKKCQGYTGYLFTGNLDLAKKVGLKSRRRIPFFSGNIECRLLEYNLYEGSRRTPDAEK
ncbi:MAG: RNA methyltransferase [Deltaproteobacteria bacterium SM23_61]|nr:MAG: RNA methyltransferase [Deltaproteobacteria bacterium SM23_61]